VGSSSRTRGIGEERRDRARAAGFPLRKRTLLWTGWARHSPPPSTGRRKHPNG